MKFLNFNKRWKKIKRTLTTFTICVLLALLAGAGLPISQMVQSLLTAGSIEVMEENSSLEDSNMAQASLLEQIRSNDKLSRVFLEKNYVCGTETINLGNFTPEEMITLVKQHPGWSGYIEAENDLVVQETVNDLSPHCKENAYMSLDKEGNLTLFEGKPKEEKAIRTFFQLDVGSMETSLPAGVLEQLQNGIRVQDIEEYNSVLSTFGDYAVAPVGNIVD
ncbi:BofC C-terminal domain-containing protein [Paenibacillus gallinarum]|uniref:BofC C-terminal domain-containing protein n=1 Tax=Paenibacillus gallinarum TaxID=2762232 RepID=A0ABR8SV60_9BACL|nr:BofC C-terminal domain-containing protein [Paenibacillus gallinarum]MBD7967402.1 BofC C-terminal domain-containing protein [Paenibacillus gallinarum]